MSELYTRSWLEKHRFEFRAWQQDAFRQFAAMIHDDSNTYPCIPGRQGFVSDHLRFGFVEDPASQTAPQDLAALLKQYGRCSRETGRYASLVVFFNTSSAGWTGCPVEAYEELFWALLSGVSRLDDQVWPDDISSDPSHPSWEFCFDGNPYFAFCATPAHVIRKSRHFPYLLLAFQPRWVFEKMNNSTHFGQSMKKAIRSRLEQYDGIPAHPSLKWYGQEDNLEWKQYFLHDHNRIPSRCPFTRMKRAVHNLLS
ncbi:YqcI/YcgG family protein [Paenibacillus validus]|uniref:YqcI/YcgG family protein n=1 Tax=Paenibacillus validus TaxID=44253 RepID=UPI003D2ABD94